MACLYAAKVGAKGHRMKISARNVAKARDSTATIYAHQFQVYLMTVCIIAPYIQALRYQG